MLRSAPKPTIVFETFWRFAAERQAVYFRRLAGSSCPWTDDPILQRYRFTNVYRAADRTSQFLIRHVIYQGPRPHREIVLRTLLFRFFNLPSTWEALTSRVGPIQTGTFDAARYGLALDDELAKGRKLYSAAYVIPPVPRTRQSRKHLQHLALLEQMMGDHVDERVGNARSLEDVFSILTRYPSLGRFLAFQLAIDLNYGPHLRFGEMDFVVPGPGAQEGIQKCFRSRDGWSDGEIIRWVTERQEAEFMERGLSFRTLWGRPLQLIDCQNIFCEIAKYSRVAHPEFTAPAGRQRIKRMFQPRQSPERPWFPPKWRLNSLIHQAERPDGSAQQLDLALG